MRTISRLAGEGIGPFKSFDFDFADASGNPHPGPHIFAGVNGSGKSTILRALAWLFELPGMSVWSDGFPREEWEHLIEGHELTRAMVVVNWPRVGPFAWAQTTDIDEGWQERLRQWAWHLLASGSAKPLQGNPPISFHQAWPDRKPLEISQGELIHKPVGYIRIGGPKDVGWRQQILAAAYGPSRRLRHLRDLDYSVKLKSFKENSLSFEATVQNEAIQNWLVSLFSKRAIAKGRGESESKYSTILERFEEALRLLCGENVGFDVDIDPSLQPKLLMYNKRLDFSQIPDGVRHTVGWLADFCMRMDMNKMPPTERHQPAALLLDEVDAHLHPKWQRSILPSIHKALPDVQVFATSHSPFVISSCPGARIHVLELDAEGCASNCPPVDAPVGESILATIKDIFGVSSRFDPQTEKELSEWNELNRKQAAGKLALHELEKMKTLTQLLSSRSEELRQIVGLPARTDKVVMEMLQRPDISAASQALPGVHQDTKGAKDVKKLARTVTRKKSEAR